MNILKKLDSIIEKVFHVFNCVLVAGMVALIFFEVFSRYLFSSSHGWADEALTFSLIWMTFLSLMIVAREDKHLRMEMFFRKFPKNLQFVLNIIGIVACIAMSVLFFVVGIEYCNKFASSRTPLLSITYNIVYSCMPIGFISLAYQHVLDLVGYVKEKVKKGE